VKKRGRVKAAASPASTKEENDETPEVKKRGRAKAAASPAAIKDENDETPEVKKRGRAKAVVPPPVSESKHEDSASPPVPQRKSGRKPKEVVKEVAEKPATKTKPAPKEKSGAKGKPAAKEKAAPKEEPAAEEAPAEATNGIEKSVIIEYWYEICLTPAASSRLSLHQLFIWCS
jgi:hypothetical protein